MTESLRLASVALGFPLFAGLFGWSVLGRVTALDREERFAASWGVGFAFLAACRFLAFAFHVPTTTFALATLALAIVLTALCHKRQSEISYPWTLAAGFGLAYLHLVGVSALLPVFRGSLWYFDWWMHYDAALVFLGDRTTEVVWANGYTLASRTPLFNLTASSVMALAGHDFATYQLASALPSFAFVAPVFLLLRDRYGRRAARLALLLAPLNLWMLHNAWFTWPKMLTAYYLLLGLHLYLRSLRARLTDPAAAGQFFVGCGVCATLGYLTHQVAAVYALPLLLHAGFVGIRRRNYRPRLAECAAVGFAGLLLAPWYGWLAVSLGGGKITGSTPVTLGDERAVFRLLDVVWWMTVNTLTSWLPWNVARAVAEGWGGAGLYWAITSVYFSQFTGALTLSLTAFLLWRGWQGWRRKGGEPSPQPTAPREGVVIALFAGLGYAGAAFLHPGIMDHGIAHSAAFPTAVLLTALAWGVLSRASVTTGLLVSAGIVAEFLFLFWSHCWLLARAPEVLEGLPGNAVYKEESRLVFLNDLLGQGQFVAVAATLAIQAVLIMGIVRWWRSQE